MRMLFAYWELKLVSLVVAVALWTYTSGQVRVERQILVEMQTSAVTGLPSSLRAASITPGEFIAVLSVPASKLDALRDEVLRPQLAVPRDRREPGTVEFPLTGRSLGLDADIRILRTEPADIRSVLVELSAIAEAVLPAEVPLVAGLPPGIAAEVALDRTQVEVRGLRDLVQAAEVENRPLRFAPIRLTTIDPGLIAPKVERVTLRPLPGQADPAQPVIATITLRPAREGKTVIRVAVGLLLAPTEIGRWRLAEDAPMVELHCSGPEAAVRRLEAVDLPAWVDLRGGSLHAGEGEWPVRVQPPVGIAVEPANVKLTLQPTAP